MDVTEQFSLPETAPPFLTRLLEAIERKGEANSLVLYLTCSSVSGAGEPYEVTSLCSFSRFG